MINIRVVETLQYVSGKLLQLVHRKIQGLHQLLELYFMDILTDHLVVASIAYDIHATQISHRTQYGVRTIQQGHLTLVVRLLTLSDEHVQASLLCRELCAQVLDRHIGRLLDYPEVEDLCLYNEVVCIRNLLLDVSNLLTWESGNDTVYQCSAYVVVFLYPLLESFVVCTEIILPQLDVLTDALLQMMTVQEDQLTRHDDQALLRITLEGGVTTIQQLHELAGIRAGRSIAQLTSGIKGDTSLCSVRDHKTNLRLICQCHEGSILTVGVQRTTDHIDTGE